MIDVRRSMFNQVVILESHLVYTRLVFHGLLPFPHYLVDG
jgi:hypothetical protein